MPWGEDDRPEGKREAMLGALAPLEFEDLSTSPWPATSGADATLIEEQRPTVVARAPAPPLRRKTPSVPPPVPAARPKSVPPPVPAARAPRERTPVATPIPPSAPAPSGELSLPPLRRARVPSYPAITRDALGTRGARFAKIAALAAALPLTAGAGVLAWYTLFRDAPVATAPKPPVVATSAPPAAGAPIGVPSAIDTSLQIATFGEAPFEVAVSTAVDAADSAGAAAIDAGVLDDEDAPRDREASRPGHDRGASDALVATGRDLLERRALREALAAFDEARRLDVDNPHAHAGAAEALLRMRRPTGALVRARHAVALRRRRAEYRVLEGDALAALGQLAPAREAWLLALHLEPGNAEARVRLEATAQH